MPMHKVRIVQTSRVQRSIVIEVEADTVEDAVDLQQQSDAPSHGDPRWEVDSDSLEGEDVTPA